MPSGGESVNTVDQSVTIHNPESRWRTVRGAQRLDRKWPSSIPGEKDIGLRGRREIHASRWWYQHVAEFQWRIDCQISRYVSACLPLCGTDSNFCTLLYDFNEIGICKPRRKSMLDKWRWQSILESLSLTSYNNTRWLENIFFNEFLFYFRNI